jgi:hypothetical protein
VSEPALFSPRVGRQAAPLPEPVRQALRYDVVAIALTGGRVLYLAREPDGGDGPGDVVIGCGFAGALLAIAGGIHIPPEAVPGLRAALRDLGRLAAPPVVEGES